MVWDSVYLGKRVDDSYESEYTLKTRAVENLNAANAFDYSIQPLSLYMALLYVQKSVVAAYEFGIFR